MKAKGFNFIELMIVIALVGVFATVIYNVATGGCGKTTYGINGLTETRCINGYTFIVGQSGSVQQMLNAQGGGVQCN